MPTLSLPLLLLACRNLATEPPAAAPLPAPPPTVSLTVTATPDDATLTLDGEATSPTPGRLDLIDRAPGTYTVVATRKGFVPLIQTVTLSAEQPSPPPLALTLEPLQQPLSWEVTPKVAEWTLTDALGEEISGQGAWAGEVPSGLTTVTFTQAGHNDRTLSLFLEHGEAHRLWLDRAGQVVEKVVEFKSGHHPKGLRFTPDGEEIWASFLGGPPSTAGYDARTGEELHELTLGKHGAVEVIYSLDGERVYASQMETASVYEIDRDSGALLRTLATKATWSKVMALSPEGDRLYVSNWVSSDITEFDLETGEVLRELDTIDTPRGMWMDPAGEWLYVVGFGDGRMQRVEVATGKREDLFTSTGGTLRHVVGDVERGRLYVSDMRKGVIWLIEMGTWRATRLARTDANPNTIDLTPDGRLLFVSCRGQNNRESYYRPGPRWGSVLVIDALSGELLDAIVAGNQPTALDVSDDGTLLAYSDMLDDRISVYRIPPYETFVEAGGGRAAVYKAELRKR